MVGAFAIDPFFYGLTWVIAKVNGGPLHADFYTHIPFYLCDLGVVATSFGLWLMTVSWGATGSRRSWDKGAWARPGGRVIGFSPGPPP